MSDKRKKLINRIRTVSILISLSVLILCVESLLTQQKIFLNFAFGVGAFGLVVISLMIFRVVQYDK